MNVNIFILINTQTNVRDINCNHKRQTLNYSLLTILNNGDSLCSHAEFKEIFMKTQRTETPDYDLQKDAEATDSV